MKVPGRDGHGIRNAGRRRGRIPLAGRFVTRSWRKNQKGKIVPVYPRAGLVVVDFYGRRYTVGAGGNLERA